jgi:NhaA family Na+:H+ antiporter
MTKLFLRFFESEKAGGIVLVVVTILSLFLANSVWQT